VPVNDAAPGCRPDAGADPRSGTPTVGSRAARGLIAVLLLATAALDLARCGLIMATARHPDPAAGLVAAGLAAAALSSWTARGHLRGRRWPAWAAVLIGAASAPQAAAAGFGAPYTIPDTATAVLGILLAVTVLATVGLTSPEQDTENPCATNRRSPDDNRSHPSTRP
jgi:peptidoglycan/LPS O-acetylase OafA/YrhL